MPLSKLLFEIWRNPEDDSFELSLVAEHSDQLRHEISPKSTLLHSFYAASDREAFQSNYDWHGWGVYKPSEGLPERYFTNEEVADQVMYLSVRQSA